MNFEGESPMPRWCARSISVVAVSAVGAASLAVGACSSSSSGSGAPSGSSGATGTPGNCTTLLNDTATATGGTAQPNSWGNAPSWLQKLPPGSTLCGATVVQSIDNVVVSTGIAEQDLESFYQSLVSANGCTTKAPMGTGQAVTVSFSCSGHYGAYTYVPKAGYYQLTY
jgi:hypothetical protein